MEDLEQLRVFFLHVSRPNWISCNNKRQLSLVGQDLSELRSIVDTRVMEKIPISDDNEAHFAEWRFTFEATCGLLGLEEVLRQSILSTHDEASLQVFAQQPDVSLKNKAVYYLLVASCRGRAQVLVRGVPKHAGLVAWRQMVRLFEPQVGLVGVLSPVWRQGDSYQFEEDLTAWDTRITEYERDSGKMVDPEVRMAVITQHAPRSMRQVVLQAAAQGGGVYTRFREFILTYLRTDKHFSSDGHGGPQPIDVGATGKGKNGKNGDGKKVDGKGGKNSVAGKGKGQGTQKFDGNCNHCKKYGHMARDCRKKKADDAQKQKNAGAIDQSSVQSTSSTASVGAVALISSTTAGSGLGRLVIAISDQGERVDAYQVLDGTRPEVVVMMAVDSESEVHTAPVTFPWNVEQFDKTSICLSDVQSNKLKVYGTALLNYGVHDVSVNVIEIGTRFFWSVTL